MKKDLFVIETILFLFTFTLVAFVLFDTNTNKPTMSAQTTYTRKELQDYVVATAASYYFNNTYTDYEGYWAEDSSSNYSSVYDVSPEELSRSKYTTMQCINFATNSYIYSLGFDFSKYKSLLGTGRYTRYSIIDSNNKQIYQYAKNSKSNYLNTYQYFSKVFSCKYANRIAKDSVLKNDPIVVLTYQNNSYDGPGVNSFLKGIGTDVDITTIMIDSKYATQKKQLIDTIKANLQPGDIYLNDHHAMVWVGDLFEKNGGVLHSSGSSFQLGDKAVNNSSDEPSPSTEIKSNSTSAKFKDGYDSYSVRYSSYDYIEDTQIKQNTSDINTVVTIIRPIDSICKNWTKNDKGEDVCTKLDSDFAKLNSNVKARAKLKYLKTEQYIMNEKDNKVLSADTSSVNRGDVVTYKIDLKNMSKIDLCSSGRKTEKSKCEADGQTWKTINKKVEYKGVVVNAKVPEGTTLVSCSDGCFCYDKNSKIVKCSATNKNVYWKSGTINPGNEVNYSYKVMVNTDNKNNTIVNNGTRIKYDGSVLTMGKITTYVNSTINGPVASKLTKLVNADINANNNSEKKDDVTCSDSLKYATDVYSNLFKDENLKRSKTDNLKDLITADNIINAYFKKINKSSSYSYTKKTESEMSKLKGDALKINQMVVPHFFGGKLYEKVYYEGKMEDEFYSVKPLASSKLYFNVGDIIITMKEKDGKFSISNAIIYLGSTAYAYCNNGKAYKHIHDTNQKFAYSYAYILNEVYSSDLYVALRPSQYYDIKVYDTLSIKSELIKECPDGYDYDKDNHKCTKKIDYYQGFTYDDYGLKDYPKLTREGYKQTGWKIYTYDSKTKKNVDTPITGDTTYNYGRAIYPVWQKLEKNQNSYEKEEQTKPTTPTEPTNPTNPTTPTEPEPPSTGNNEEIIEANIEHDGEPTEDSTIYYKKGEGWVNQEEEKITKTEIPTKEGYEFKGYYTEKDGKGSQVIDSEGKIVYNPEENNEDISLYAKWEYVGEKKTNYITYIIGGVVLLLVIFGSIFLVSKKKKIKY